MSKLIMNKAITIIISLLVPMTIFQVSKILAYGIQRMNSVQSINLGLKMIGFGDAQTGIIVMMILSLITYMISDQIIGKK